MFNDFQANDDTSGPIEPFSETSESDKAEGKGLPPLVTVIGAGLTVVLGVATTISGISANGKGTKYDNALADWKDASCDVMDSSTCSDLHDKLKTAYNAGHSAEVRTNVLLASTLVMGAATAVIGIFFTDWPEGDGVDVLFGMAPDGSAHGEVKVAF